METINGSNESSDFGGMGSVDGMDGVDGMDATQESPRAFELASAPARTRLVDPLAFIVPPISGEEACERCGSTDVERDWVDSAPALCLAECLRCALRWTRPMALPMEAADESSSRGRSAAGVDVSVQHLPARGTKPLAA